MAPLPWFRVLLNRLSFLTRPIPLVSSVMVIMLGLFIWDYTKHPEWFGTYTEEEEGPNVDADLSGLTPEEQALAADIDNLNLLLNDLGVTSDGVPNIQAVPDEDAQQSLLQELLALSEPTAPGTASTGNNPFDRYLQEYRFLGAPSPSGNQTNGAGSPSGVSGLPPITYGSSGPGQNRMSALGQALQNTLAPEADDAIARPTATSQRDESANNSNSALSSALSSVENGDSRPVNGEGGPETVMIPGIPYPVLPTTPQMSPPPGTTGYTPPASLNVMPPVPNSGNSAAVFPAPGAPILPSGVGASTVPSAATGNLNLNTPQVDVSNGAITPYTPLQPVTPAVPATNAVPFSAPRPPGSYIGGGYINTFSNPSKPPEQ